MWFCLNVSLGWVGEYIKSEGDDDSLLNTHFILDLTLRMCTGCFFLLKKKKGKVKLMAMAPCINQANYNMQVICGIVSNSGIQHHSFVDQTGTFFSKLYSEF